MQNQTQKLTEQELIDLYDPYSNALDVLHREAEIEGGKVKDAIFEGFTTFVSFHVTRLLAWNGKIIISDPKTKQESEIDELQFVGNMAGRADKTIQSIRNLMK